MLPLKKTNYLLRIFLHMLSAAAWATKCKITKENDKLRVVFPAENMEVGDLVIYLESNFATLYLGKYSHTHASQTDFGPLSGKALKKNIARLAFKKAIDFLNELTVVNAVFDSEGRLLTAGCSPIQFAYRNAPSQLKKLEQIFNQPLHVKEWIWSTELN